MTPDPVARVEAFTRAQFALQWAEMNAPHAVTVYASIGNGVHPVQVSFVALDPATAHDMVELVPWEIREPLRRIGENTLTVEGFAFGGARVVVSAAEPIPPVPDNFARVNAAVATGALTDYLKRSYQ